VAVAIVRGLVDRITPVPEDGRLSIPLRVDLAAKLVFVRTGYTNIHSVWLSPYSRKRLRNGLHEILGLMDDSAPPKWGMTDIVNFAPIVSGCHWFQDIPRSGLPPPCSGSGCCSRPIVLTVPDLDPPRSSGVHLGACRGSLRNKLSNAR
jgi:hypothetical protein